MEGKGNSVFLRKFFDDQQQIEQLYNNLKRLVEEEQRRWDDERPRQGSVENDSWRDESVTQKVLRALRLESVIEEARDNVTNRSRLSECFHEWAELRQLWETDWNELLNSLPFWFVRVLEKETGVLEYVERHLDCIVDRAKVKSANESMRKILTYVSQNRRNLNSFLFKTLIESGTSNVLNLFPELEERVLREASDDDNIKFIVHSRNGNIAHLLKQKQKFYTVRKDQARPKSAHGSYGGYDDDSFGVPAVEDHSYTVQRSTPPHTPPFSSSPYDSPGRISRGGGVASNNRSLGVPWTLVLDLDETLVHSEWEPDVGWKTIKRPGVDIFLSHLAKYYELIIFTAGLPEYAGPVIDDLDRNRVVSARYFRDSTTFVDGSYVKDLGRLGRDLRRCIIIDNLPESYLLHPNNAIHIQPFYDDPEDTALLDLMPFLEKLVMDDVEDCREILCNYKGIEASAALYRFGERRDQPFGSPRTRPGFSSNSYGSTYSPGGSSYGSSYSSVRPSTASSYLSRSSGLRSSNDNSVKNVLDRFSNFGLNTSLRSSMGSIGTRA